MTAQRLCHEPVVITGIGMMASVGRTRDAVWHAVRHGRSGVGWICGLRGIPDGELPRAQIDLPESRPGRLKVLALSEIAADEALRNAGIDWDMVDRERFGCLVAAHMGDVTYVDEELGPRVPDDPHGAPWWQQWLPDSASSLLARRYGLGGPSVAYSTACATSLVSVMAAVRNIRGGQCDIALTGGADAIDPLFAAGFHHMRVLAEADDPQRACRPCDRRRNGFVLGEGAAFLVVERLSHALARGARIYAEVSACRAMAEAHHVTGLSEQSDTLARLISETLRTAGLRPGAVGYVNAHGTGTQQNDLVEMRGIRQAFGPAATRLCVSSTKSILGHMINAAGSVELAITVLAMRDGFAPPPR